MKSLRKKCRRCLWWRSDSQENMEAVNACVVGTWAPVASSKTLGFQADLLCGMLG